MLGLNDLPHDLAAALKRETKGELIRWTSRPDPGRAFLGASPIWLMGVPWSALTFTLFGFLFASIFFSPPPERSVPPWEYVAMGAALIFAGSFVLIGLAMLFAPFLAWHQAQRTVHAITDKRLVSVIAGRSTSIKSVLPAQLVSFERKERADGSGTLKIVTGYEKDSEGGRVTLSEELIGVSSVATAERLLQELQAKKFT